MSENFQLLAKRLYDKSACLSNELKSILTNTEAMREKIDKVLQNAERLKNTLVPERSNKCSICFTRERQRVFTPCGHVVCTSCCSRAENRTPRAVKPAGDK